jgi:hypothetical protein
MNKNRVLILDNQTEAALLTICDVVLKFAGLQMATMVAQLGSAIRDPQFDGAGEW